MILIILAAIIFGLICIIIGMIIESVFENNQKIAELEESFEIKKDEVEIIEINDPDNYFKPF